MTVPTTPPPLRQSLLTRPWAAPLAVALLAFAASIGGLLNRYAQDDIPIIWKNPAVHRLGGVGRLFVESYWPPPFVPGLYRPAALLSFVLQWTGGGGAPVVFRLVSYALYAAAAVALFLLARRMLPPMAAALAAALFAVHPVHVEAVAIAVNQGELWVALLSCIAVGLYLRARRHGGEFPVRAELGLAGIYLVACLFKENALVLPGLLLLAELLLVPSTERFLPRVARIRRLFLTLMLVAVAFMGVRTLVLGGDVSGTFTAEGLVGLTKGQRALTMLAVVPAWFRLLFWPSHLQADYSPAEIVGQTVWGSEQTLGLILLLGTLLVGLVAWRKAPAIAFGIAWCAIALFPVHNVLVPTGIILAERTLFLPSLGAVIALAGAGQLLLERATARRKGMLAVAVGILLILGTFRSNTRHQVWSDQFTLWYQTANEDAPRSFRAHEALAETYFRLGLERLAEEEYRLAVQFSPRTLSRPTMEYAGKLRLRGFCYPAADLYRKVVAAQPNHQAARLALGACLVDIGFYREAMFHARIGISYDWERPAFRAVLRTADSAYRASAPAGTVRVDPSRADSIGRGLLTVGTKK